MVTGVTEYLPTERFSKTRSGDLILRRMSAVLVFISSMNPSLGPFRTVAVGGSATARFSALRCENMKRQSYPSANRATSPSAILPLPSSRESTTTSWQKERDESSLSRMAEAASLSGEVSSPSEGRVKSSPACAHTGATISCSNSSLSERLSMKQNTATGASPTGTSRRSRSPVLWKAEVVFRENSATFTISSLPFSGARITFRGRKC